MTARITTALRITGGETVTYPDAFQSNGPTLGDKADSLRGTSTTRGTATEPAFPEALQRNHPLSILRRSRLPDLEETREHQNFMENANFCRQRGRKGNLCLDDHSFQQ